MKKTLLMLLMLSSIANAGSNEQAILTQAEAKFKKTFNEVSTVIGFAESPIPGIWEMNINGNMVYYYPPKDLLLFGEIYDKSGASLTQLSLQKTAQKKIEQIDSSLAISIGKKGAAKKIIEIIDPDCQFCRRYHEFISEAETHVEIDRRILFESRIHPSAIPKIKHIICSDDPKHAYDAVMSGSVKDFRDCADSNSILAKHVAQIDKLGVNATPSFVVENHVIIGFDKEKIEAYLHTSTHQH